MLISDALTTILAARDPVGLIKSGAPQDEYASEAQALAKILAVVEEREALATFWTVFTSQFNGIDLMGNREQWAPLASTLWQAQRGLVNLKGLRREASLASQARAEALLVSTWRQHDIPAPWMSWDREESGEMVVVFEWINPERRLSVWVEDPPVYIKSEGPKVAEMEDGNVEGPEHLASLVEWWK